MHRLMVAAALSALSATSLVTVPAFAQSAQSAFPPAAYDEPVRAEPRHHLRQHHGVRRKRHKKPERSENLQAIALKQGYKKVSDLVQFPNFFPGLGIIYVKPDTLPLGPFLCFDRQKRLVATVYMVPIKDIDDHKTFDAAARAFAPKVDHTTMYFNAGHPGVDMPHYHIVLWHVSKDEEKRVAQ